MKRKPKKHVVVSDMYDTIYSDVVMEDLKEFYPDASDELLDELASDLYFDNRRLLMNTFADTIFPTDVINIAELGLWDGKHSAFRISTHRRSTNCSYLAEISRKRNGTLTSTTTSVATHIITTERIATCIVRYALRLDPQRVGTSTTRYNLIR